MLSFLCTINDRSYIVPLFGIYCCSRFLDHFFGTCSFFVQKPPKFHGNNNDLSPKSHQMLFFSCGKSCGFPKSTEVKHHYDGPVADFVQQAEPLGDAKTWGLHPIQWGFHWLMFVGVTFFDESRFMGS